MSYVTKVSDTADVVHNSDWSGMATVRWRTPDNKQHEVELPGQILLALGAKAAVTALTAHVIGAIETWEP